jgi:hypothetical protein
MTRYCFSGHESFQCKSLWLKKGYDYLSAGNSFLDADAVTKLGVGKNMVSSIRFWLRAFGLINNDKLTPIAHFLFNNEYGKDPFIEDINTLWILHYLLITTKVASIYHLIFEDFHREKKSFDKEQVLLFIKRKCNVLDQKNVYNENTVKKDIRVFLQNYVKPNSLKSLEEFTALLINLNLIRIINKDDTYSFNETDPNLIDPTVILYSLLDIKGADMTLSFDVLQDLSLIFCIPIFQFLDIIKELSIKIPDVIHYTNDGGIRNVQFLKEIDKFSILNNYYNTI